MPFKGIKGSAEESETAKKKRRRGKKKKKKEALKFAVKFNSCCRSRKTAATLRAACGLKEHCDSYMCSLICQNGRQQESGQKGRMFI